MDSPHTGIASSTRRGSRSPRVSEPSLSAGRIVCMRIAEDRIDALQFGHSIFVFLFSVLSISSLAPSYSR